MWLEPKHLASRHLLKDFGQFPGVPFALVAFYEGTKIRKIVTRFSCLLRSFAI